tara:strand:+ start:8822 stop:9577 length:756 start_codon:yes stop_codon:yes gene_type:complete
MNIVSAQSITQKGGIKVAIQAIAGMGKTMLAATCTKPIVILTERTGATCLSEANIRKVYGNDAVTTNIPVVEAYTIADFEDALDKLMADKRFDTIFIDSTSELSKMLLAKAKPNYKNKLQAYGDMAEQIDIFIRSLNDAPKNIVFLFHSVASDSWDEEGEPMGTVMVPGFEGQKMKTDFPFLNGEIYVMVNDFDDDGEETRMIRTRQGDTNTYAKNRSGTLNDIEPPHIDKLFAKLRGSAPKKKKKPAVSK